MAHGTALQMRLYNHSGGYSVAGLHTNWREPIKRLHALGYRGIQLIEINYTAALANGLTEIGAPNAVFDGTSTAAVVYVDSDSASDTAQVTIIGLTEAGLIGTETVTMTGTTGVATTGKWQRIFHAYQSSGTADAVGNIYVQDDAAGTNKYLSIAAGAVDSEGAAIWVPDDRGVIVCVDRFCRTTVPTAAGDLGLLQFLFNNFNSSLMGTDSDYDYEQYSMTGYQDLYNMVSPRTWEASATGSAKLTIKSGYIGNAITANHAIAIIVFDRGVF